jgi:hypothetical protein
MRKAHEQEVLGIKVQYDAKLGADRMKIDELTKECKRLLSAVADKAEALNRIEPLNALLQTELDATRSEIGRMGQEMLAVRRECSETLATMEREHTDKHLKQTETLMNGYQAQINKINADTERRMQMLVQQQKVIEEELVLAEARFNERPSRDEDIARIAELEVLASRQAEQIRFGVWL